MRAFERKVGRAIANKAKIRWELRLSCGHDVEIEFDVAAGFNGKTSRLAR